MRALVPIEPEDRKVVAVLNVDKLASVFAGNNNDALHANACDCDAVWRADLLIKLRWCFHA